MQWFSWLNTETHGPTPVQLLELLLALILSTLIGLEREFRVKSTGLPILALFVTAAHFLVMYGYTGITHRILC